MLLVSVISVYTERREDARNDCRECKWRDRSSAKRRSCCAPDQPGTVLQRSWARLRSMEPRIQYALWLFSRGCESVATRGDAGADECRSACAATVGWHLRAATARLGLWPWCDFAQFCTSATEREVVGSYTGSMAGGARTCPKRSIRLRRARWRHRGRL